MVDERNLTDTQIAELAKPLVEIITVFYRNPQSEKDFQEWLKIQNMPCTYNK